MAGAPLTAEQQAIMVLHQELALMRSHVTQLIDGHEALKAAHDALNWTAEAALADKEQRIQDSETRLRNLIFRQQFDLLDAKKLKPDKFRGRISEPLKPCQRKLKAFCNSKPTGF